MVRRLLTLCVALAAAACSSRDRRPEPEPDVRFGPDPPEHGLQFRAGEPPPAKGRDGGGGELQRCVPIRGARGLTLRKIQIYARPGLHHAMLLLVDGLDEEIDCPALPPDAHADASEPPWVVFRSPDDEGNYSWELPEGIVLPLPEERELVLNYHFTSTAQGSEIVVNLVESEQEFVRPSAAGNDGGADADVSGPQAVWPFGIALSDVSVQPRHSGDESVQCVTAVPVRVLLAVPFSGPLSQVAAVEVAGGSVLVENARWDDPSAYIGSSRERELLDADDRILLRCAWLNNGDEPITEEQEWCMAGGLLFGAGMDGPIVATSRKDPEGGSTQACTVLVERPKK